MAFAEAYQGLKQREAMEKGYRKAITLSNANQYYFLLYASAIREFNDNEKAKSILTEGIAVTENSEPALLSGLFIELARIALEENDPDA